MSPKMYWITDLQNIVGIRQHSDSYSNSIIYLFMGNF